MKRKLAVLLCVVCSLSAFTACGSTQPSTAQQQNIQTNIRLDACGLSYTIPENWTNTENVNLFPTSYAQPKESIYALVRYDYAPDENMEELDNPNSEIPVEELMVPLLELLVVRNGQETADSVEAEFAKYQSKQELPSQEGFRFYYLTDPVNGVEHLSETATKTYTELTEDLPSFYKSIETFVPDEEIVKKQATEQSAVFSFSSSDLDGNAIDSSIFADYDLTVVNFFGSYSYPDINELSELQTFYQNLQTKHPNINFLQVVIDTPDAQAEQKMKEAYAAHGVTFRGVMPDVPMAAWILENIHGLPTTIFVDKNGHVLDTKIEQKQTADYYMEQTETVLSNQ